MKKDICLKTQKGVMTFSHFVDFGDNQIWKEAFENVKRNDFNVDLIKFVIKPSLIMQGFMIAEQYPLSQTSIGTRCINQPFETIAKDKGWCFSAFLLWDTSIFSSQGQLSSNKMTVLVEIE